MAGSADTTQSRKEQLIQLEFLVRFRWNIPAGMTDDEWNRLLEREHRCGEQLRASRVMKRSWNIPGRREALALFESADATELHVALCSLPIFPLSDITVEPLAAHEMDTPDRFD